jgi:hypothetical protein
MLQKTPKIGSWPPDYLAYLKWRAATLQLLQSDPVALLDAQTLYRKDPAQFIDDWIDVQLNVEDRSGVDGRACSFTSVGARATRKVWAPRWAFEAIRNPESIDECTITAHRTPRIARRHRQPSRWFYRECLRLHRPRMPEPPVRFSSVPRSFDHLVGD